MDNLGGTSLRYEVEIEIDVEVEAAIDVAAPPPLRPLYCIHHSPHLLNSPASPSHSALPAFSTRPPRRSFPFDVLG
jgi:hypothetical protein